MIIMLSLIVIAITCFFKRFTRIHEQIKGKWIIFLYNLFVLKTYKKKNPKSRLDLHDIFDLKPENSGFWPFPEEEEYAKPKKAKGEDLFIYGTNTGDGTILQVSLKRRPLCSQGTSEVEPDRDHVQIKFRLDDGTGNVYWLEEESTVEFNSEQYHGSGFAFEILNGNKTNRIKFRGYLRKNQEDKLYYVRIRFLCLFYSKIYDHQRKLNEWLMAADLAERKITVPSLLEDKMEQFCQIKGTFQVEDNEEEEMFFMGAVGRRFLPKTAANRKITKLFGFTHEGFGFQVGLVTLDNHLQYRYGFASKLGQNFKLLEDINIEKQNFENLENKSSFKFEATFFELTKKFEISKYKNNYWKVKVDDIDGLCFIETQTFDEIESSQKPSKPNLNSKIEKSLVVSLREDLARLVELTGGKGASLAQLHHLASFPNHSEPFSVPEGLVVTTSAFQRQLNSIDGFQSRIKSLCKTVYDQNSDRKLIEQTCQKFVEWFSKYPLEESVRAEVESQLRRDFGQNFGEKLFAVRSSAAMEDSSEMSAAGQMTTYLGVSGFDNICSAVVKCWASQFAFVPIEYKRGYGQELNSPMAVVINQMVNCDAAGVIFTCNPSTGDERFLTITSNFGIGESVVSASADPDTFELSVDIQKNTYECDRKIGSIVKKTLGKKSLVTRLSNSNSGDLESGVHNEENLDGAERSSLTDQQLLRLGTLALKIQQHYGNPRDIEFGIKDDQLHIFQSRPITNLDSGFTSYELMHETDTPHMSEQDVYSRAHWGENFPGASSWVACYLFLHEGSFMKDNIKKGMVPIEEYNPYRSQMGFVTNHLMFNINFSFFTKMFEKYPEDEMASSMVLAFFGHHITDKEILEIFKASAKEAKENEIKPLFFGLKMFIGMFYMLIFAPKKIPAAKRIMFDENRPTIEDELKALSLDKMLACILSSNDKNSEHSFMLHGPASFGSTFKTMFLRKLMKSSAPSESDLENDLNFMLSSCNDVISAEVPNTLREIARAIDDKDTFQNLSDEEAVKFLQSEQGEAGQIFTKFIKKHKHRGYREFDPLHKPWGQNPIPCVQIIKTLIRSKANLEPKKTLSTEEVLKNIKTPLSWWRRLLIKYWFLPWCRDAVGFRENTKSLIVKSQSIIRDGLLFMGKTMVEQGILPEVELVFFLKFDEIKRLASGERNPLLVMKAKQRKRLYQKMNQFKYDEFVRGFRMRPREFKKETITISSDAVVLKGTAVTVGDIKARVCVAENIEDAHAIEQGDILITYSTDIGWSPYFPLVSGIVTEIGGTISHGAVIAREFGLPCLIAVENACHHFRTGDIAYLDTKSGTITKVTE